MGRAVCARRERRSRLSLFGLRRPAGPASSPSLPRFLSRLPRAAARLALALLLLAGAGVGLSTEARAQTEVAENWSLKPSSVVAGEQFRLLIVTSTTRNAQSSTIGDYDTHVQNAVAAGHTDIQSYSSGFKAVGCTGSVDARDHTSTTYTEENLGIPIFYLDGDKVADNYKDFYDGTWNSQSPKNESGNSSSATRVWTGCESDGTEHSSYPLGDSTSVQRGNPSSAIRNFALSQIWTSGRNSSPLYGLSGVFQVAGEANTGPSVESAEVTSSAPKELVIDFDETLDTGSVPSASAFTVKVGGSAGPAVSSVAVSGDDVTLGLAVALDAGQTNVTVDYAKPGSNPLQSDADSEEVASFTNRAVTNNAPACPTGQPAAAFWTACLTVGAQSTNYGYDTNFGALSDGSFTRNGVDFAIIRVMNSRTGVSFVLIAAGDNFSPVAGAVLQVDGTRLALADATQSPLVTGRNYLWASPGFTWTSANVGDKVSVSLRPNAAPTASDNTVETDEDGEYTFDAADFGFMDTDPSAALASVKIVSVETAGDLQLGGAGVTADEVVTKTDLDDGELVFTPVSGEHGSPYATFTFKVNDGTDDSDDAYTMTIDVDSVPDTTGVSVTSTPRSGSGTEKKYGEGETIQVTVTFDEAVDVTGDPHVDVQVGSNERDADYESGSGSTELVFEYEVLSADRDTNGISISADDLQLDSDDEIQDGDGNDASVSFSATGNLGGHKVDGSLSDTTAPSAVSASVGRGTVTILFDEPLDSGSVPARTAFSLKRTRSGTEGTATLTGTPSISGATVTLEIASASAVLSTDTALKVAYAKPGSGNKLEDAEGNEVADFTLSGNKVTNDSNSPPTSADTVVGISEDRASVFGLVSFDAEYNDPDGDPLAKVVISEIEFSDEWRGQLSLAGVPLSAGTGLSIEVTRAQLLSTRDFAITPAPDFFGEAAVKITYRVNDGTEDSADSYVMTVDVANVNDEGTGRPEILGELVRMTALQAGKGTMADVEGLPPDAELRWQWVRQDDAAGTNEEDIPGATGPSYWLEYSTRENGGKWLAVKVTYEDGGGTEETLKSEAIGPLLRSTPYSGKGHHLVTSGDCRGQAFPPGAFWTGCLTIGKNTFGFTSYGFGSSTGALDNPIVHHEGEDYEFTSFAGAPNTNYVLLTLTSETRNEPVVRSWVLTIGNHAPSPLTQYFASTSTGQLNFDAPIWDDSDVGTSVVVSLRPSDMTAPRMVLGWALDRTVTLAYDEPLREGRVPEKGAYTARVAGRPVPVETVAVAGREVTLRLAESAGFGTVDVRYEPWHRPAATWVPRGKPLEDLAGNEAAGFGWRDVANVAAACGEAILGAFWESCALLQGEAEGISARLAETGFEEGGTSHAIESVFKATGGAFSVEFAADPGAAATGWELVSGGTVLKLSEATKHPTLPAYTWNPGLAWTAADIGSVRRLGLRPVTSLSTAVPGAPQADATPGDGEARIDWTAPEYDGTITGWQFRQGAVASPFAWGGWTDVEGATAETASHTVTGLENGTTYLFQVRAMAGEVAGAASNRAGTTPVAGAVLSPKMSVSESESRGNPWDGQSFSFRRSTESGGARGCAVEVTVEFLDEDGDAVAVDALAASDFTVRNGRAGTPVAAADGLSWTVPARANAGFTGLMRVQLAETARWRADEQVFRVASDTECAPVARNALRRLALEGLALDPAFDAATTAYAASAPADMAEVTVTASAVYGAATVAYAPADADGETEGHQVALPVGETEVTVTVTPPGGEAEDAASWTVTVTRAAAPDPGPLTGFVLVDASDDADLGAVADGGTVTVSADGSYGIRAEVGEGETVGSVKLRLEGPGEGDAHERTENVAPYSLHGDANGGREHGRALAAGSYTLTATAHSGKGGAGDVLGTLEVSFTAALEAAEAPSPSGPLTGFVLVDASDDADLGAIADGGTVTVSADGSYGIRAEVGEGETVGSVKLRLEGPGEGDAHERTENVAPYSLHGDAKGGREHGRALPAGSYTLTATANSGKGGAGDVLGTLTVSFDILAPPALSVADAEVREGPDATLDFEVTLDREAAHAVTVNYATADATASAGSDYTATSGTLTFGPGDTEKTVSVPVLEDDHDDAGETLTLTLSDASGATIADGEATGTITNDGPVPRAWLARYGRTVAEQALAAVRDRMAADRTPGFRGRIAGEALPGGTGAGTGDVSLPVPGPAEDDPLAVPAFAERERRAFLALLAPLGDGGEGDARGGDMPEGRSVTAEEAMLGTAFEIARETGGGLSLGFWGRAATSGFSGRDGDLELDGDVTSAMLGTDWRRRDATFGLLLFRSRGEGGWRSPDASGTLEADLAGLVPWAGLRRDGGPTLWGAAGTGRGEMRFTPGEEGTTVAGLGWSMAAAGAESAPTAFAALGGADLRWRADALWTRTASDAAAGDGGFLSAASGEIARLRLGLEAGWETGLASGAVVAPRLEAGLRLDGGDAETGFGLEAGGGVRYRDPGRGLSVSLDGRTLALHEDGDFEDWGVAVTLEWDPRPETRLGPSVIATRGWGGTPSGGVAALLDPETLPGIDGGGDGSLDLEMAWGTDLSSWRHGAVGSAYGRVSGSGDAEMRLGWRVAPDAGLPERAARDFWLEPGTAGEAGVGAGLTWSSERRRVRSSAGIDLAAGEGGVEAGFRLEREW